MELQNQAEFKKRVIETSGLIILDNNVVLDKTGKIVADTNTPELLEDPSIVKNRNFLPEINGRLDFK